jgi:hypothetical protein
MNPLRRNIPLVGVHFRALLAPVTVSLYGAKSWQLGKPECGVLEVRVFEQCPLQLRFPQHRTLEIGAHQVCALEIGAIKQRPLQPCKLAWRNTACCRFACRRSALARSARSKCALGNCAPCRLAPCRSGHHQGAHDAEEGGCLACNAAGLRSIPLRMTGSSPSCARSSRARGCAAMSRSTISVRSAGVASASHAQSAAGRGHASPGARFGIGYSASMEASHALNPWGPDSPQRAALFSRRVSELFCANTVIRATRFPSRSLTSSVVLGLGVGALTRQRYRYEKRLFGHSQTL